MNPTTTTLIRDWRRTESRANLFLGYNAGFGIMVLAMALRGQVPWWLFIIHTLGTMTWYLSRQTARAQVDQLTAALQHDAEQVFDELLQDRLTDQDQPVRAALVAAHEGNRP